MSALSKDGRCRPGDDDNHMPIKARCIDGSRLGNGGACAAIVNGAIIVINSLATAPFARYAGMTGDCPSLAYVEKQAQPLTLMPRMASRRIATYLPAQLILYL